MIEALIGIPLGLIVGAIFIVLQARERNRLGKELHCLFEQAEKSAFKESEGCMKYEVVFCDKCGQKIKGWNYSTMGEWHFCTPCSGEIMESLRPTLIPREGLEIKVKRVEAEERIILH